MNKFQTTNQPTGPVCVCFQRPDLSKLRTSRKDKHKTTDHRRPGAQSQGKGKFELCCCSYEWTMRDGVLGRNLSGEGRGIGLNAFSTNFGPIEERINKWKWVEVFPTVLPSNSNRRGSGNRRLFVGKRTRSKMWLYLSCLSLCESFIMLCWQDTQWLRQLFMEKPKSGDSILIMVLLHLRQHNYAIQQYENH